MSESLHDDVVQVFKEKNQDDLNPKEIAFALDREDDFALIESHLTGSAEFEYTRHAGVDRYYKYVGER